MSRISIVLHEPEIPANTGNIGRTCSAAGASLYLIEPLGFHLTERHIKRAGMDYWDELDLSRFAGFEEMMEKNPGRHLYLATTKAERDYTQVRYEPDCMIMFGKESAGIPEEILMARREDCVRIPMLGGKRSLNLGNAAAIVLYEALRQNGFPEMETAGQLHHHRWGETP